jgi:co-chaperonin GroES (HSP10)
MTDVEYGYRSYGSMKIVGDKVFIRKLRRDDMKCIDGIFVPDSKSYQNSKMGVGEIIGLGDEAKEKLNLKEGDYILYDYYSAHGDWKDRVITNGENVILQLTEKEANDFLNGTLVV